MVLALSGGEIVYFELEMTGQLVEVDKKELSSEIACLDMPPVPEVPSAPRAKPLVVPRASADPRHYTSDGCEMYCKAPPVVGGFHRSAWSRQRRQGLPSTKSEPWMCAFSKPGNVSLPLCASFDHEASCWGGMGLGLAGPPACSFPGSGLF